jgi:hypothetical protein
MQTFQQALIEHVLAGIVEREVAANAATNQHDFLVALEHAEKVKLFQASQQAAEQAEAEPEPAEVTPVEPLPTLTLEPAAEEPALRVVRPAGA